MGNPDKVTRRMDADELRELATSSRRPRQTTRLIAIVALVISLVSMLAAMLALVG